MKHWLVRLLLLLKIAGETLHGTNYIAWSLPVSVNRIRTVYIVTVSSIIGIYLSPFAHPSVQYSCAFALTFHRMQISTNIIEQEPTKVTCSLLTPPSDPPTHREHVHERMKFSKSISSKLSPEWRNSITHFRLAFTKRYIVFECTVPECASQVFQTLALYRTALT